METGLVLLGLVGIIDPPREEAVTAVAQYRAAGIQVKMITGDHTGTAAAIAVQMGLAEHRRALTGVELEQMSEEALRGVVEDVDVFARASPEHKLRLVQALQARARVVAMTGDGVNDAPALKRADVGVAMGIKGTDIHTARSVAVNTLVTAGVFYLFNTRFLTASVLSRDGLLGNRYVLIAVGAIILFQLLFTYLPLMQHFFGTAAIDEDAWLRILGAGTLVFIAVEAEKALLVRRHRRG